MTQDWAARLKITQRYVVMMGRYGGQSMNEVEDWPMRKLIARIRVISDLVGEEQGVHNLNNATGVPRP